MLISRALKQKTDLFIGVVIDCSGSMSYYESMEKAKRFGALLAEAARGNPGIDVRLFGFTDQVIYDAGNATRCAVHSLAAGGGNNDAAGLWHAAGVARSSRRRAKLLVMISDGEPTECSVASLKALVERLTRRWKICCAQVAVQPLTEICFPNYVLLEENNLDECVARFGAVMARLVRQALAGG
jgi:Mg-chelatase subunit ChlD